MLKMFFPIAMVIISNTVYNIAAKSTPENVNAFLSLSITYMVAMLLAFAVFFLSSDRQSVLTELKTVNWASFALGFSIVPLELGYILIYRFGWRVSAASLTANIGLACVLLIVGVLLYKEAVSIKQLVGMIVCAAGLFLMNS